MTDEPKKKDVHLGMFDRPRRPTILPGDVIAAALSVVWIMVCGLFFLFARAPGSTINFNTLNFVVTTLAILLPVALIWVAAVAARSVSVVREESVRLQAAMDILRQNYVDLAQSNRLQVKSAALATSRAAPAPPAQPVQTEKAEQGDLALGLAPAAQSAPLSAEDFVRALNFPKTVDDKEGFRALRRALADPHVGRLVQASQDILTLLSQDGVYMDDLVPDRARPEVWRQFAAGARGRAVATLGGIHDRASLDIAGRRMRQDHIFRDAAHHFLRQFDRIFGAFAQNASDAEIAAVAETRTARAFMLMGRVAGTFD